MIYLKDVYDVLKYVKSDKVICTVAFAVVLTSFLCCFLLSPLTGSLIFCCYLSGLLICGVLLKYHSLASYYLNQLSLLSGLDYNKDKIKDVACSVCNGPNCDRLKHNTKLPWKSFYIDNNLNDSIEQFFNHILDDFVTLWYQNVTNDKSFLCELKYSLRYALAAAAKRFMKLDIGHVVANKLIPCGIKHVDDYLCMMKIAELTSNDINKIAVEYLGKRLHIATSNRANEFKYLQSLSLVLIERLLPADNLKCKNFTILLREILTGWVLLPLMDVLADPNIINSLVILITTYKPKKAARHFDSVEKVEFLKNYSKIELSESALALDLRSILKNPKNFYFLMQFLKKEGCVHLLNFYLDVEAFNGNLLKPDLNKKQLEDLHNEAVTIYKNYLDPNCKYFIGCSLDVVQELKSLLDLGVYKVAKLQTTEPLFKASEFAFDVIEKEWLPLFYHSSEFYNMICGSKNANNFTKSAAARFVNYNNISAYTNLFEKIIPNTNRLRSPFITQGSPSRLRQQQKRGVEGASAVAKISNSIGKIKGALQPKQPVDGAIYQNMGDWIPESDAAYVETLPDTSGSNVRDLSSWKCSIPAVETHQYGSKLICIFNISVQRNDSEGGKCWIIKRRDQDFYTLKAKLMEFHGENEISHLPLPSRRSPVTIDLRKHNYEEFLKSLLEKPMLRGSDLLHTFLTAQQNFTMLVTAPMPFVDLENIYQSVAYKLRKEKGQHLDSFMNTFLNSTGRAKPAKFEWAEYGDEIDAINKNTIIPKTRTNSVFGNNFGITYNRDVTGQPSNSINPNGLTESVFYLLQYIFKVPTAVLKLYVAVCRVAQQAVDSMCRRLLEHQIKSTLPPITLAFLINQVENLIFSKHSSPTAEELEERKKKAFDEITNVIPKLVNNFFDFSNGLNTLLTILQNPLCNKQLAYNLIDIVIGEMYPELDSSDEFY